MKKIFYFLSGLLMEKGSDKISLGRVSWWILFLVTIKTLWDGSDIPPNHLTILLVLATYNLGKKVVSKIKSIGKNTDNPNPEA